MVVFGNMSPKSSPAPDDSLDAQASVAAALESLFDPGERVSLRTHNGATFDGTVEDSNLVGIVIRTEDDRVFFVSFAGIESAELFDGEETEDDPGDGEAPDEEIAPDIAPATEAA